MTDNAAPVGADVPVDPEPPTPTNFQSGVDAVRKRIASLADGQLADLQNSLLGLLDLLVQVNDQAASESAMAGVLLESFETEVSDHGKRLELAEGTLNDLSGNLSGIIAKLADVDRLYNQTATTATGEPLLASDLKTKAKPGQPGRRGRI